LARISFTISLMILFFSSCTSWKNIKNTRSVASSRNRKCRIVKHEKRDYYRLLVNEKPMNKYWYGRQYVEKIKEDLNKKGQCK